MLITILCLICVNLGVNSHLTVSFSQNDSQVHSLYYEMNLPQHIYDVSDITVPLTANIQHLLLMDRRATELNIPKRLLFRLVFQESKYDSVIVSPKHAYGYMQLMPKTYKLYAKKMSYTGKHTPEINIIIGTKMLSDLYHYWLPIIEDENIAWIYALASYNAGKQTVIIYDGIPPYKKTQDYIAFINQ